MKIRLEPLNRDHIDGIMTWVNDPEVTFYFAKFGAISREEELVYVDKLVASEADRIFSIFDDESADDTAPLPGYLGQIGLSQIYWPARNARLGIMLPRYAWGRGVAQAAAKALLRVAFDELELNKVWLIVRCTNAKGLHLWTKVGFQCEGILRQEYFSRDEYHDMMRLSVLRDERQRVLGPLSA